MECPILCDTSHVFEKPGARTLTFSKGADSVDFALGRLRAPTARNVQKVTFQLADGEITAHVPEDYHLDLVDLGICKLPSRWLTCCWMEYQGGALLIDCGEGTQVALREAGCKLSHFETILVTHFHADHVLGLPPFPNGWTQKQTFEQPNQAWEGGITYILTGEGWLYLATVKDLCTEKVVGYAFSSRIDTQLTLAALDMAIRREKPDSGLIFHSDRGFQYAAAAYRERLAQLGIRQSMSRKGDPVFARQFSKTAAV